MMRIALCLIKRLGLWCEDMQSFKNNYLVGRIPLIARGIQPNPKSEVQISIENVISGPVKEGYFVAIQLPRLPPFSSGLASVGVARERKITSSLVSYVLSWTRGRH